MLLDMHSIKFRWQSLGNPVDCFVADFLYINLYTHLASIVSHPILQFVVYLLILHLLLRGMFKMFSNGFGEFVVVL